MYRDPAYVEDKEDKEDKPAPPMKKPKHPILFLLFTVALTLGCCALIDLCYRRGWGGLGFGSGCAALYFAITTLSCTIKYYELWEEHVKRHWRD